MMASLLYSNMPGSLFNKGFCLTNMPPGNMATYTILTLGWAVFGLNLS